jgi:acyl dehydratase
LRRVGDAVFKQPVKIGDTVHVEGQIVRTREVDSEHGLVEARLRILNQRGRLAVRTDVELVWRT